MANSEQMFLAESKVILLYIINKVNHYISHNVFVELVARLSDINYFLFEEVLDDLLEEKYIIKKDEESLKTYMITNEGKQVLNLSITMLPGIKKLQIDTKFKGIYQKLKEEKSIVSEYIKQEDDSFKVFLRVIEFDKIEFEIKVIAYSEEQVQKIIDTWKKDANKIYQKIIKSLTDNKK